MTCPSGQPWPNPPHSKKKNEVAGEPPATPLSSSSSWSALGWLGHLRGGLDGGLPTVKSRLLGLLHEGRELLDRLAVALHPKVEQTEARVDRGILRVERRLEGALALRRPRREQVAAQG